MSCTNKNSEIMNSENICRNNKFGFCKFADKCRYKHVELLCEEKTCEISNCEKRHPKICIYQRDFGRCKFTSYCKYNHGKETNTSDLESKIEICRTTNEELKQKITELDKRIDRLEKENEEKDRVIVSLPKLLTP